MVQLRRDTVPFAPGDAALVRRGLVNVVVEIGDAATRNVGRGADQVPPGDHRHLLDELERSGATNGQVPTWTGAAWVPRTPVPGPRGPRGFQGPRGEKGDPGNYVGLALIGASDDLADRPLTADDGDAWGLLQGGTIRLFFWVAAEAEWFDAGLITQAAVEPVANTIYVAENGSDTNSGTNIGVPVRSLERACEIANQRIADNPLAIGRIDVGPGIYPTEGDIETPPNWALICAHRTAIMVPEPGFEENNVFLMDSGTFLEGFTSIGWRHDSMDFPTKGFLAALKPGALIDRLPYIHKCVAFRVQPKLLVSPPMDRKNANPAVGPGAGVLFVDGAAPHPKSTFKQAVAWGGTGVTPNGVCYHATNNGLIHLVNGVMLFAHDAFRATAGGRLTLTACETQFGDYSHTADGHGQSLRTYRSDEPVAIYAAAAEAVRDNAAAIIDTMWDTLVLEGLTAGWTEQQEFFTRRDAAIFLQAVDFAFAGGTQRPVDDFTRGLFKVRPTVDYWRSELVPVFAPEFLPAFTRSFEIMRDAIKLLPGVTAGAGTMLDGLVDALNLSLTAPRLRKERSLIDAGPHKWNQPLTGVTRSSIPPVFGGAGSPRAIARAIRQRRGGRVIYSGQNDAGDQVFVGGLRIDSRTGKLSGRPFDTAVELRLLEIATAG